MTITFNGANFIIHSVTDPRHRLTILIFTPLISHVSTFSNAHTLASPGLRKRCLQTLCRLQNSFAWKPTPALLLLTQSHQMTTTRFHQMKASSSTPQYLTAPNRILALLCICISSDDTSNAYSITSMFFISVQRQRQPLAPSATYTLPLTAPRNVFASTLRATVTFWTNGPHQPQCFLRLS